MSIKCKVVDVAKKSKTKQIPARQVAVLTKHSWIVS